MRVVMCAQRVTIVNVPSYHHLASLLSCEKLQGNGSLFKRAYAW